MANTAIERRSDNTVNIPQRKDESQQQVNTWYTPLVDIIETGEAFLFQADLPGVSPDDLDVSFQNGVLSIEGKVRPRPAENYVWQEYGHGHFYRQFSINTPVDADKIKAELKNGVLELHVPKAESARTRRIEIKS
jgi:HSP20 family protein